MGRNTGRVARKVFALAPILDVVGMGARKRLQASRLGQMHSWKRKPRIQKTMGMRRKAAALVLLASRRPCSASAATRQPKIQAGNGTLEAIATVCGEPARAQNCPLNSINWWGVAHFNALRTILQLSSTRKNRNTTDDCNLRIN